MSQLAEKKTEVRYQVMIEVKRIAPDQDGNVQIETVLAGYMEPILPKQASAYVMELAGDSNFYTDEIDETDQVVSIYWNGNE